MVGSSKILETFECIQKLDLGKKYLLFKNLQEQMRAQELSLWEYHEKANNFDYVKSLLLMKKELAIETMLTLIPFLRSGDTVVKEVYLRILPVLFSYVSLYDMRINETFEIIEILQVHSAFKFNQRLFSQWFALFNRRKNSRKCFSYKDESYVRDLPCNIIEKQNDRFKENNLDACIGYTNVSLVRAFHRWLRLHRLHKYLYFFVNLSYEEVLGVNDENIDFYEEKLKLQKITIGAKNKILREIEILRGRRMCLEEIIRANYVNSATIGSAVREIKRILRTPICVNDVFQERIPEFLVRAMKKVSEVVFAQIGKNDDIIPIFGLLISVLKEAWNYYIFKPNEKELFNEWRQLLSDKINKKIYAEIQSPSSSTMERIIDTFEHLTQEEVYNPYYHLESVANNTFNFLNI